MEGQRENKCEALEKEHLENGVQEPVWRWCIHSACLHAEQGWEVVTAERVSMRSDLRICVHWGLEGGGRPVCYLWVRWEEVCSLRNGSKACLSDVKSPWRR